jgi:hypothetical protein
VCACDEGKRDSCDSAQSSDTGVDSRGVRKTWRSSEAEQWIL